MRYSEKEMKWLLKHYNLGRTWDDISARHDKKKGFPVREKSAIALQVSRYIRRNK